MLYVFKKLLQQRNTDPVVDQNIVDLLQLGAIRKVSPEEEVFISQVFTVPKVERGVEYARRFIINLKVSFILIISGSQFQ